MMRAIGTLGIPVTGRPGLFIVKMHVSAVVVVTSLEFSRLHCGILSSVCVKKIVILFIVLATVTVSLYNR